MKVVFVVGTTASGKSAYAFQQAQQTGGAIVNCDSVQVYQGLVIGSALPSAEEMRQVPHYLFSYVPKGQRMTAGQYARDFFAIMQDIQSKYPVIYVVGGTGFYFQAIEKGLFAVQKPNLELRALLESQMQTEDGAEQIYQEMLSRDPDSGKKIHRHDHYRIARAVELMRVEQKPLGQIWQEFANKKFTFPWPLEKIGLRQEKAVLQARVRARTYRMLQQGLVQEVQNLLDSKDIDGDLLQSVGYRETVQYLQQHPEIPDLASLEAKIVQNTLKLAKKQRIWFQRDSTIRWIEG